MSFGYGIRPDDLYRIDSYADAARLYRQIAPIRGREDDPRPLRESRRTRDSYALDKLDLPHPLYNNQLAVCYAVVSYKMPAVIYFPDGTIGLPSAHDNGTNWIQNEYLPRGIDVYGSAGCKVLDIAARLLGPYSFDERCAMYRQAALPGTSRYVVPNSTPFAGSVMLPFAPRTRGWQAYREDPTAGMLLLQPVFEFGRIAEPVRFVVHGAGAFMRNMKRVKAPFARLRKAAVQQVRMMTDFSGDPMLEAYTGNPEADALTSLPPAKRMIEVAEKLNHMVIAESWQPGQPVPERIMNYMMRPISTNRWQRESAQDRLNSFWEMSCLSAEKYVTNTLCRTPRNVQIVPAEDFAGLDEARAEIIERYVT